MNIEEITKKVDTLLQDRGLGSEYQEQAVRQLLYHLFVAIDIYRYMSFAEKAKAGWWYRVFKGTFSLRNFLKERKRNRERKNPPCTPLIKKGAVEKGQISALSITRRKNSGLKERQTAFWNELLKYEGKYDKQTLQKFYYVWAEEVNGTGMMRWETKTSWSLGHRLAMFPRKSYQIDDKAAELRLERAKNGGKKKDSEGAARLLVIAQEREAQNARREEELQQAKKDSVSYEEWLALKKR